MKYGFVIQGPEVENGPLALMRGSFKEKLEKAKKWGYDGIELMVRDPSLFDWDGLKAEIELAGMEIPQIVTGELYGSDGLCLVTGDEVLRSASQERVRSVIDLAAFFKTMVNMGRLRGRLDFLHGVKDASSLAHQYLAPIFKYALDRNVRITLEPLNRYESDFINSSADAIKFITDGAYENVGIMLDTFHMNIEERTFEEGFHTAGDKLWHVHIADSNRKYPGSGHIDFKPIFNSLRGMNYSRYISAELLPLPDPDTAAKETIEFLKEQKRS
jgi:sugar phosphate isomerase/epimerase